MRRPQCWPACDGGNRPVARLAECRLEMHPTKTKIVYWAGGRVAMIIDPKSRTARPAMIKRRFIEIAVALGLAVIFAAPPASVLAGDYRLGVSDRVKIKMQEWPDLGGEYTVTPDGVISLPLIGNIDAVGLSLKDLGQEI